MPSGGLLGDLVRHAALRLPGVALALAALGFLGLGPQPPSPEWGLLLSESIGYVERAPWTVLGPAGALVLTSILAVSVSSLERQPRDRLGPRQIRRRKPVPVSASAERELVAHVQP